MPQLGHGPGLSRSADPEFSCAPHVPQVRRFRPVSANLDGTQEGDGFDWLRGKNGQTLNLERVFVSFGSGFDSHRLHDETAVVPTKLGTTASLCPESAGAGLDGERERHKQLISARRSSETQRSSDTPQAIANRGVEGLQSGVRADLLERLESLL